MKAYWRKYDKEVTYCETPKGFVIASNGIVMGVYSGKTIEESLDAYAQDAGCENYESLKRVIL